MRLLLQKLDAYLAYAEKAVVVLLFSSLIILIGFNILSRNVWQTSYHRILEISPTIVVWLALFGATLALRSRRHIKLELFVRYLSPELQTVIHFVADLFSLAVMAVLFAASFSFVQGEIEFFGSWGWVAVVFPLFFCLATFRFTLRLVFAIAPLSNQTRHSTKPPADLSGDTID